MTVATLEKMNGTAPVAAPGARRVTPPLPAGAHWTTRRRFEPGETWRSDEGVPSKPLTPLNNDERNLPLFGKPLRRLPIRDFSRSYPGYYAPYSQIKPAVWPEIPPMPSGYGVPPLAENELSRAISATHPHPAVPPEHMVCDISGFGSIREAMAAVSAPGIGGILEDLGSMFGLTPSQSTTSNVANQTLSTSAGQAATGAVQQQAQAAQSAGASPSLVQSIINFGSQIAGWYLTKRQMDDLEKMKEEERQAELQKLQLQAQIANAPAQVRQDLSPAAAQQPGLLSNPIVVGAMILGGAGLAYGIARAVA